MVSCGMYPAATSSASPRRSAWMKGATHRFSKIKMPAEEPGWITDLASAMSLSSMSPEDAPSKIATSNWPSRSMSRNEQLVFRGAGEGVVRPGRLVGEPGQLGPAGHHIEQHPGGE